MGKVRQIKPAIVSMDALESGIKVFWCDKTINRIIRRIPE